MENYLKKSKKREMKLNHRKRLIFTIGFFLCGVILGVMGFFLENLLGDDLTLWRFIIIYVGAFVILFATSLIHTVLHEIGHLIFGLITGYQFVSFRVGSILWMRQEGKLVRKKFSIPGTGGQCLLAPPNDMEKYPYLLYNMGGVIMNTVIGLLALFFVFMFQWKGLVGFGLTIFGGVGLFIAAMNGIPMKLQVANDGYNAISIRKSSQARKAFYAQLKINALLNEGYSYGQIPTELLKVDKEADMKDSLMVAHKLMEYNYYLEQLNFPMAHEIMAELSKVLEQLPQVSKYYVILEKLFLFYVDEHSKEDMDKYNTKEFQDFIKMIHFDINIKRFVFAKLLWEKEELKNLRKAYDEYNETKATYPIKGEVIMNDNLMDYLMMKNEITEEMISNSRIDE